MELKQAPKRQKEKNRNDQFAFMEIYRQLRTNIEYSSFEKRVQVVNTVSTNPAEGKSSIASNLALVSVVKYANVLLMDCDLRKPVQHKIFNVSNKIGLSNLMKNYDTFDIDEDTYFQKFKDSHSGGKLYLLTSGAKVPNPQELLSSSMFSKLLENLKTRFDFIIIDCPPVSIVSDSIPVSNLTDGTIFVISARKTDKNDAKNALKELQRNGANILGSVLTMVEAEAKHYYDYNSYGNDS